MSSTRPSFDDKNETISNPLGATVHGVDGDSRPLEEGTSTPSSGGQCAKPPAGWTCSREPGHEGPCAATPILPTGVSVEEAAQGAGILFDATKKRMGILLTTLVRLAESGDFALWCPLAAMDEQFRSMDWTSVPPLAVAKFYKLVAMTLTTYATRLDEHAMAVLEGIKTTALGLPDVPIWTGEDTVRMYDAVESIFAVTPIEAENAVAAEQMEKLDE